MAHHHREVMLQLKDESVVAIPDIIGVQDGDVVEFTSKIGTPKIKYEPSEAVKRDPKGGGERITVLQAPFEFYCSLEVGGKTYEYKPGTKGKIGGGIAIPDPPDMAGMDTSTLPHGSLATVVTITGSNFYSGSAGLVDGAPRFTQFVDNTSVRITVTTADLAKAGSLRLSVKNLTESNSLTLTVT